MRVVVDSSGWLEFFVDGPNAAVFAPALVHPATVLVPALSLYEVARVVLRERGGGAASQAVALMRQGQVVAVGAELAMVAAHLGHALKLSLGDSTILAIARAHGAELWTQDADFKGLDGVRYVPRKNG